MRIRKDGTVALSKGERRAGNFVVSLSDTHVRITAISGIFSMRLSRQTTMGRMLAEACAPGNDRPLAMLCSWLFKVGSIVPDAQAMAAVTEIYGMLPARMQRRQGGEAVLYPSAGDMEERVLRLLPAMGVDIGDNELTDGLRSLIAEHFGRRKDYYTRSAEDIGTESLREFYSFIRSGNDTGGGQALDRVSE